MRIAVASQGTDLSAKVDTRFGRAPYFLIYDTHNEQHEVVLNGQNVNAAQGAGVQAAATVSAMEVDLVIAGNFGPKAFKALNAAGADVATWAKGSVSEALDLAEAQKLEISQQPSVEGHWQ